MKFLIVDDSATMRRIVANSLQRIGFTDFFEAADGAEALGAFDSSVGFIITDWNMPRMSGLELCSAIRAVELNRYIYVLMVTSYLGCVSTLFLSGKELLRHCFRQCS